MSDNESLDFDPSEYELAPVFRTIKTFILINETDLYMVKCRDFNKILADEPEIAAVFLDINCYRFGDRVRAKMDINGQWVDMGLIGPSLHSSPLYVLPGRGELRTVEELRNRADIKSRLLLRAMERVGFSACFINWEQEKFYEANPTLGDKILDEADVVVPPQWTSIKKVESQPVEASKIDPKKAN